MRKLKCLPVLLLALLQLLPSSLQIQPHATGTHGRISGPLQALVAQLGVAPAQAAYTLVTDDQFTRSATTVGSGANSTTGLGVPTTFNAPSTGGATTDFAGNLWNITSSGHASNTATNTPSASPVLGCAYRPSVENCIEGKQQLYSAASTKGVGAVFRFNTTSGGNGYSAIIYSPTSSPKFLFYKTVNGTTTALNGSGTATGVTSPSSYIFEAICSQTNGTTTTLTVNLYDQTAPTTVVATLSQTDTTASLQNLSGGMGMGMNGGMLPTRWITYQSGGALTSGVASSTAAYKTHAVLSMTGSSGGSSPLSYQWYRSTTPGFTPGAGSIVSGATSTSLSDSGLTAGTAYYYVCRTTDNSAATIDSNQVTVTTLPTSAVVLGFCGDSITFGVGATSNLTRGSTMCVNALIANGYNVVEVNAGVSGSTSGVWVQGQANYNAAVTAFQAADVSVVHVMIGTNDSKAPAVSSATYLANLSNQVNGYVALGWKVVISYSPWNAGNGAWDSNSNPAMVGYEAQIDSLVNNTTIYQGDQTAMVYFNGGSLLPDGTHPNDAGHLHMGYCWANAIKNHVFTSSSLTPNAPAPSQTNKTITLSLSMATPSGGLGPFVYQWYTSVTNGFTPGAGNMIAGATSSTLTQASLDPTVSNYFRCIATDALGQTSTSPQYTLDVVTGAVSKARTHYRFKTAPDMIFDTMKGMRRTY